MIGRAFLARLGRRIDVGNPLFYRAQRAATDAILTQFKGQNLPVAGGHKTSRHKRAHGQTGREQHHEQPALYGTKGAKHAHYGGRLLHRAPIVITILSNRPTDLDLSGIMVSKASGPLSRIYLRPINATC